MSSRSDLSRPTRKRRDYDLLLALFFFAWRGFAAEPDALLETEGLGRVHHRILFTLVRVPGIRVGDLAKSLGVSRQALHRTLSELHERGLVSLEVAERSAREKSVKATRAGARIEARASGAQRRHLERVFESLDPKAADGWVAVMRGLALPVIESSPLFASEIRRSSS